MAHKAFHAEVGAYVYKHGRPSRAGVVTKMPVVVTRQTLIGEVAFKAAAVSWVDGTTSDEILSHLNLFDALIADHEKKLATHSKTRLKLDKLKASVLSS